MITLNGRLYRCPRFIIWLSLHQSSGTTTSEYSFYYNIYTIGHTLTRKRLPVFQHPYCLCWEFLNESWEPLWRVGTWIIFWWSLKPLIGCNTCCICSINAVSRAEGWGNCNLKEILESWTHVYCLEKNNRSLYWPTLKTRQNYPSRVRQANRCSLQSQIFFFVFHLEPRWQVQQVLTHAVMLGGLQEWLAVPVLYALHGVPACAWPVLHHCWGSPLHPLDIPVKWTFLYFFGKQGDAWRGSISWPRPHEASSWKDGLQMQVGMVPGAVYSFPMVCHCFSISVEWQAIFV